MPIKNDREYRALSQFAPEEREDKTLILRGTPVVFNSPTVIWEYGGVKYYEVIDSRAFDSTDFSDFIFNYNHSGRVFARNRNGSLSHEITAEAMNITATLDGESEAHRELYRDVQSGRIDKMSFSFTVEEQSINRDTNTRTILKIKKIYDVSAVDIPAYNDTNISARAGCGATPPDWINAQGEELARRKKILILKTKT